MEQCLTERGPQLHPRDRMRESGAVARMPQCVFPSSPAQPDQSWCRSCQSFSACRPAMTLTFAAARYRPAGTLVSSPAPGQVDTPFWVPRNAPMLSNPMLVRFSVLHLYRLMIDDALSRRCGACHGFQCCIDCLVRSAYWAKQTACRAVPHIPPTGARPGNVVRRIIP